MMDFVGDAATWLTAWSLYWLALAAALLLVAGLAETVESIIRR